MSDAWCDIWDMMCMTRTLPFPTSIWMAETADNRYDSEYTNRVNEWQEALKSWRC